MNYQCCFATAIQGTAAAHEGYELHQYWLCLRDRSVCSLGERLFRGIKARASCEQIDKGAPTKEVLRRLAAAASALQQMDCLVLCDE
jgi:hypothetical protein